MIETKTPYYQLSNGSQVSDIAMYLNFSIGNVIKYLFRAGKKENNDFQKDVKKALDYIQLEKNRIETLCSYTPCLNADAPLENVKFNYLYLEKGIENKYAKRAIGMLQFYIFEQSRIVLNNVELLLKWLYEGKYEQLDYKFFNYQNKTKNEKI